MGKALILALFLAGCSTTGQPVQNPREIWCDHNAPRRPSEAGIRRMTRAELDEMNAFNAKGIRWCNWSP